MVMPTSTQAAVATRTAQTSRNLVSLTIPSGYATAHASDLPTDSPLLIPPQGCHMRYWRGHSKLVFYRPALSPIPGWLTGRRCCFGASRTKRLWQAGLTYTLVLAKNRRPPARRHTWWGDATQARPIGSTAAAAPGCSAGRCGL